jgi:hypothetical protein
MCKPSIALLAFVLGCSLSRPAAAAAPFVWAEPLKGVIVKGQVLTFERQNLPKKGQRGVGLGEPVGWLAPLEGERSPLRVVCTWSDQGSPRWHVGHGACWIGRCYTPGGIPHYTADDLDRYELLAFLRGQLRATPEAEGRGPDRGRFASEGPMRVIRTFGDRRRPRSEIEYDYLSVGNDKVRTFLLTNFVRKERVRPRWSFTVHSYSTRWREDWSAWDWGNWFLEESIEVAFREPFQVLGKGCDYYFVTASGRLFLARKAAKGKQRPCVPVWSDARRRIRALITDADANRTFLFVGPAKKGGKPAFFELSARPRLVEYDPRSAKPLKEGPERLRRVTHYARVLLAHKVVKDR